MAKTTDTRAARAERKPSRRSVRPQMTERRAKQVARQMINDGSLSPSMLNVIESLATAGALTTLQLERIDGVKLRTLQRMFHDPKRKVSHIVDHLWADEKLSGMSFQKSRSLSGLRVWKLGVLGAAIANERELSPVTYDTSFRVAQITHDVACAEICSRLFLHAETNGWGVEWLNKNDARVFGKFKVKKGTKEVEKTRMILEPDALLKCRRKRKRDGKNILYAFCVEFHNEDGSKRVEDKVSRYAEFVGRQKYSEWKLEKMPSLLVGFRNHNIEAHYIDALRRHPDLAMSVFFMPTMGEWVNVSDGLPLLRMYNPKKATGYEPIRDMFI